MSRLTRTAVAVMSAALCLTMSPTPASAEMDQLSPREIREENAAFTDPDRTEITITDTLRIPGREPVTTVSSGNAAQMERAQVAGRDNGGSDESSHRGCRQVEITVKQPSALGFTTLYTYTNQLDWCWTRKNSRVRDVAPLWSYDADGLVEWVGTTYHRHGFYAPAGRPRADHAAYVTRRKGHFRQCISPAPCTHGYPEISIRGYWNGTYLWARAR